MQNKYFFHADTSKYGDRLRRILITVFVPLIALCVFCTVQIVLNYRSEFALLLLAVIGGSVLFGMIFAFSAVYITEKYKRRHARYTFFDFLPCGMVFSEYAGEYVHWGDRVILRRLYFIPFETLESVSRDPKKAPHDITFKGEIRGYFFESSRLGYHVNEDGGIEFDTEPLNDGMFEKLHEITVKNRFGNTKRLEKSALYYLEQYKNIPEKKPFVLSDFVTVRRRHKPTTSNPALEAPSYNRDWK
ncbi:MAG: hypothetical protein HDT43_03685 [Ruminococcaceae bacterium]|nr:hypothetical protein [Oscillospiraceae bacterium]